MSESAIEAISRRAFMDEAEALLPLLAQAESLSALEVPVMARASAWTRAIRERGTGHGVEAFLHTYGLGTGEGVALMCLAEALLRIPDAYTADALIRDTFESRHWERFTGGESWLVNLSGWGLLLTGKIVDFGHDGGPLHLIRKLVARLGEPVIREALKKAMALIGNQFVLGQTIGEALKHNSNYPGYRFSFDMLGEGARSDAQAEAYVQSYLECIEQVGKSVPPDTPLFEASGVSVKLSALHPRYQLTQRRRLMEELLPRLKTIAATAKQSGIAIAIDAEEASRLDIEMLLFERLLADPDFSGWNGIGFVVQAYQKRAFYLIDWLAELAQAHRRVIPVRLVKGAYWDSEIKWAQIMGLPSYPVFTRKAHTDVSYLACADKLLRHRAAFYPQFATHNARSIASVMELAHHYGWKKGAFEFQRLHGMGEALHDMVLKEAPSRIYAPVGPHKDLLAYLIRRLLENGANSSFVHLLLDRSKTPEDILADPVAVTRHHADSNPAIPLPVHMYDDARKNSSGMDFGNLAQLNALTTVLAPYAASALPEIPDIAANQFNDALAAATHAFPRWSAIGVIDRVAMLERAAGLIEQHAPEFISLCAREAGRTLADGMAEVREAADYCRYYAAEAKRLLAPQALAGPAGESSVLSLHPRGVFACISPWNFPLAIFTGQIVAALAAGNCVIAKPAEQTPRIAARAVQVLLEAGIPREVLHLAPGNGESVGAALVADARIAGVVFTGGTETARRIQQSLAGRSGPLIPLIAETGGQNCMVVDSSALPEQAVDDIILSAFGSAGQRCSSLRVLFVQEEIADRLIGLLAGAMQELTLGNPLDPATDIGPVIDREAQTALLQHIDAMKASARLIAATPLPHASGCFVAPHAFEIRSIAELKREMFGPVLHVIRFPSGGLPQVIDAINSTGYGLTCGIHSRIDEHIHLLASRVRAGNIYVNRSMIGATVGVQPFGGEGLSGTGPKAGGPHYLLRFLAERTITVNTAAIGGNVTLLEMGY
ncbi:MAG: L-glutamate gamma-semialdehyde dehydrogenase [Pseudomonadota bacterium]|nr:L-glutamate gamma-semialdehyde dehydrogenase [Pseudomonadota bacterium]